VLVGTDYAASYEGFIDAPPPASGKSRRMGVLTMTKEALETSIKSWSSRMATDHDKFGADRLEVPTYVVLVTINEQGSGLYVGYSNGDIGNAAAHQEFEVQVACDVAAAR